MRWPSVVMGVDDAARAIGARTAHGLCSEAASCTAGLRIVRIQERCLTRVTLAFPPGSGWVIVHRLCDAFEREHLRDEQVHDVGLDAGAVLQRSGHRKRARVSAWQRGQCLICASA